MKKLFIVFVIIAVISGLAILAKDMFVQKAVEKGVEAMTGLRLTMGSFKTSILKTLFDIRDMRLYNPAGFKDPVMADVPRLYVDYEFGTLLEHNIHMTDVILDIRLFTVVKNEQGLLNLNALSPVKAEKEGRAAVAKEEGAPPKIRIDKLRLKIGKVIYKDYSRGPKPVTQEFTMNIDETFTDLDDAYAVVSIVVVKALTNTAIANMVGFDLRGLRGSVTAPLATAQTAVNAAVSTAGATVQRVGGVATSAENTVKNAAGAVADILADSFGAKKK